LFRLFEPLLHAERNHLLEQYPGHGLIAGQVQSALGVGRFAKTVSKDIDSLFARMETHMLLLSREMY